MIRDTSSESFRSITNLGERQRAVYEVIRRKGQACNLEISDELGLPINSITPRTRELVELGIVEQSMVRRGPNGRQSIYWRVKKRDHGIDWDAMRRETIAIQQQTDRITNSDQPTLL